MKILLLVLLLAVVMWSFSMPIQQPVVDPRERYPVYLDPQTMYLDQPITYSEWPQE